MSKTVHLIDLKKVLCYKLAAFLALLLLSYGLSAKDLNLAYLPTQAVKVSDGKYQLMKDFNTSIKQIRNIFVGDDSVKDELIINEENYSVHLFYNLKKSSSWHKIYVILRDDKVFARIFK